MTKTRHLILGLSWKAGFRAIEIQAVEPFPLVSKGHDQLLEICLLEKTGRHNFQLLDTIPANDTFFLSTGWIRLIFGDQLDSISFTFSQKKYQLLELQMVDKVLENVNCLGDFT